MTEKQPTQEQIKEFWKRCGLKQAYSTSKIPIWVDSNNELVSPVDGDTGLPIVDLNTLFEYAVPKLKLEYRNWQSVLHNWVDKLTGNPEKDAIKLYWILDQKDIEIKAAKELLRRVYKELKQVKQKAREELLAEIEKRSLLGDAGGKVVILHDDWQAIKRGEQ